MTLLFLFPKHILNYLGIWIIAVLSVFTLPYISVSILILVTQFQTISWLEVAKAWPATAKAKDSSSWLNAVAVAFCLRIQDNLRTSFAGRVAPALMNIELPMEVDSLSLLNYFPLNVSSQPNNFRISNLFSFFAHMFPSQVARAPCKNPVQNCVLYRKTRNWKPMLHFVCKYV